MNRANKKYDSFRKICKITSADMGMLRRVIEGEAAKNGCFEIIIRNEKAQMEYGLNVLSQTSAGEYVVELYEKHGTGNRDKKMIIKNIIRTEKPVFARRQSAVSAILGVIILMGIAVVGGAAFMTTSMDLIDESYFDVERISVHSFGDSSDSVYMEFDVSSSIIDNLSVDGDIAGRIIILDGWNGRQVTTEEFSVIPTQSGLRASYEGVVELDKTVSPGDHIVLEFTYGDGDIWMATAEVRRR